MINSMPSCFMVLVTYQLNIFLLQNQHDVFYFYYQMVDDWYSTMEV
jgi:hypothetical protein